MQPGLIGLLTVLLGQCHTARIRRDKLIVRVIVDDRGAVTLNIDRKPDDLAVQSGRPVVAAHRDLRADGDDRTGQLVICVAVDLEGRMVCVRQIDQKTFIGPAGRCEKPVGDGPIPVNTSGGGNEGHTVAQNLSIAIEVQTRPTVNMDQHLVAGKLAIPGDCEVSARELEIDAVGDDVGSQEAHTAVEAVIAGTEVHLAGEGVINASIIARRIRPHRYSIDHGVTV